MIAVKSMAAFEHGGNVYEAIDPAAGFNQWLDFSANINPLGRSAAVKKSIEDNIDKRGQYPGPKGSELKRAISQYYGVPEEEIVLGNGASELFYVYMHAIGAKNVKIPVPSFSEYERSANALEGNISYFYLNSEDGFTLDVSELAKSLNSIDTVMIGNPNNPTGNLLKRETVEALVKSAEKTGTNVVVDESFLDFREDRELYTVMDLVSQHDNLIVMNSLTKFYALPGLRLGFAVMKSSLREKMEKNKDPWNVNLLAQKAGTAALKDAEYQSRTREAVGWEAPKMAKALKSIEGLKVCEPAVNFVMFNIKGRGITANELTARMKAKGILIRDCSNYPGLDEYYVRVAVRSAEENKILLKKLEEALNG